MRRGARSRVLRFLAAPLGAALLCLLVATLAMPETITLEFGKPDHRRLDGIPIGGTLTYQQPAGDGCNIMTCSVTRASENEVRWNGCSSITLAMCAPPALIERFK